MTYINIIREAARRLQLESTVMYGKAHLLEVMEKLGFDQYTSAKEIDMIGPFATLLRDRIFPECDDELERHQIGIWIDNYCQSNDQLQIHKETHQ